MQSAHSEDVAAVAPARLHACMHAITIREHESSDVEINLYDISMTTFLATEVILAGCNAFNVT